MKNYRIYLRTLALFLAAAAVFFLSACGETPSVPASTDTENTQSQTTDLSQDDPAPDPEALKAAAVSVFADAVFSAKHIAVYDATADVMLYGKGHQTRITAASTTKLLTALTMLDHVKEDTVFTVGSELSLVGAGSSSAKLKKGYKLTTEQILDALLIPSGNDAAYVIAAHVGRNLSGDPQITDRDAVDLFLEKMNEKAKAIGTKDSNFTCPDGYPNKTQYTTAEDMMLIAVAASKNQTVMASASKNYALHTLEDGTQLEYVTTNQLMLPSSVYFYEGTFGMKTGSTPAAGQCLISGASAYGHDLIVALFKAPDNNARYEDTRKALDLGFEAVKRAESQE